MKTHVEFQSNAFPPYPGEEESINPGVWGKRLAELLVAKLPEYGFQPQAPYAEDWGWEIPIQSEPFPMFVGCGNQLESGGNHFLCFIDPSKPMIRRGFFRKVDTRSEVAKLADALNQILSVHPQITALRWWNENEAP